MEYREDDKQLNSSLFIPFVNKIWPGNYDMDKTQLALSKTINITAYDDGTLVGCLRILSDGYYFGTITELLVLPEYQKRGSAADCSNSQKGIPQPCCILARNRVWSCSMKKMGANEASRPTSSKKSTVTAHLLKSNPLLLSGGKKPASRKIS